MATPPSRWAGSVVRSARAHWRTRLPLPCALCGGVVDGRTPWVVEHLTPRAHGGSVTDRSNQWVSHRACSDRQGGRMGATATNARRRAQMPGLAPPTDRGIRGL